ncbi:MAG: hypothetical protein U9P79_10135 [Candidatus Cloacimonadota bacterium]|nr:hypothetical protein [Candidatus Cloacimonadota bacterium]
MSCKKDEEYILLDMLLYGGFSRKHSGQGFGFYLTFRFCVIKLRQNTI